MEVIPKLIVGVDMPVRPVTVVLGITNPAENVVLVGAGVPSTVNVLLLNSAPGIFVMWYRDPTTGIVGGTETTNVNVTTLLATVYAVIFSAPVPAAIAA
jgi:hypothetical protein